MLRGIGLSDDDAEVIVSTEYQQMRNQGKGTGLQNEG